MIGTIRGHVQRLSQLLDQRELGLRSLSTVVELTMTHSRLTRVLLSYPVWIGVVGIAMVAIPIITAAYFLNQPKVTVLGKSS